MAVVVAEKTMRFSLSTDQRTLVPDRNGSIAISCPETDECQVTKLIYSKGLVIGLPPNRHVVQHFPLFGDD